MSDVFENSTWLPIDGSFDEDYFFADSVDGSKWMLQKQKAQRLKNGAYSLRTKSFNFNWAKTGSKIHLKLADYSDINDEDLLHVPHQRGRWMDWDLFDGKSRWIYQNEDVYFGWKWEKIRSELTDIKFCIREIAQLAELDQERRMRLHQRLSVARKRHIQPLFFPEPARLVMWSTGTIGAAWSKLIQEYTSTETQGFCKICNAAFERASHGGPRRTYCSDACKAKAYRRRRR